MKNKIILLIIISVFLTSFASAKLLQVGVSINKTYYVNVEFVDLNNFTDYEGQTKVEWSGDVIDINILDRDKKTIESFEEDLLFMIFSDPPQSIDIEYFFLELPYYENARYVQIKHAGNEIKLIKLDDYIQPPPSTTTRKCFIATKVYGSEDAPQVEKLREIRDKELGKTEVGRNFVDFYYSGAGEVGAEIIDKIPGMRQIIRILLDRIVKEYGRN